MITPHLRETVLIITAVVLAAAGFFYFYVIAAIRRTAEWIRRLRLGQQPVLSRAQQKLMGPLVKEMSKVIKSLDIARAAAKREAQLRFSSESIWTAERLREFVRVKLDNHPLFVISNREPYMHLRDAKGAVECHVPPSGLVTALEPVLKACDGTWIAQASGDADRQTADEHGKLRVPPDEPQYTLKRVWLKPEEEQGYYYGFANEGLWPLCHIAHTRPIFREQDWLYYKAVNEKFLAAILEELEHVSEPYILVQDYHFALLPGLIKAKRPDAHVAIFWHIPWPNPESFGICPWQRELLKGMLGADVVGFHTQFHCNNFIATVDRFLESRIDYEHFTVNREGQTSWIKPFPISIAFTDGFDPKAEKSVSLDGRSLLKPYEIEADFVGVGVDRLDFTKGILERFLSVETFLEKNPDYRGRFTFVELGAPSRILIPRYQELVTELEKEVQRINERFKDNRRANWKAILFLKKNHSHDDIVPFYKAADFCMVTSLHDGMNLVSKEYVNAREDERGVLILSQFTGAARELQDALVVNPYDIGQMAEAVRSALEMPLTDQKMRMKRMREIVRERNIYRWAADLVGELTRLRTEISPKEEEVPV